MRSGRSEALVTASRAAAAALALVLAASPCQAQQGNPPPGAPAAPAGPRKATIALVPFQASPEIYRNYSSDIDLLYDSLLRIIVQSNKFDVLERTRIDSVMDENQLATSSLGDPANIAQLGKLSGAQYVIVGTVRDLGVRVSREAIPYTTEYKCTESARLRMEVRVIRTETGKIVSADSAGDSKDPAVRSVSCGRTRGTVLDDTMNRVAAGLVDRIVDRIYPITVIYISGDELTLNRGEGGAISVGASLECFTQGEAIVDPATGETLGADEALVGRVTITKATEKMSKARAEAAGSVPNGAVCRFLAAAPREKPRASAPAPKVSW